MVKQKEYYSPERYDKLQRFKKEYGLKHIRFINYLFFCSRQFGFDKIKKSESKIINELYVTKDYITQRKKDIEKGKYPFVSYKNTDMGIYLIDYIILEKEIKNIFKPEFVEEVKKEFRYSVTLINPNYYKTPKVKLVEDCELNLMNEYENISLLLNRNESLINSIADKLNIETKDVINFIQPFLSHIDSIKKEYEKNSDMFNHFKNWVNKQPINVDDFNKKFKSFVYMFNQVSQKKFVGTDEVKTLFIKQLNNGFTGKQMLTAIRNLYKDNWHLKEHFKYATPKHLLEKDNLNKYLNLTKD